MMEAGLQFVACSLFPQYMNRALEQELRKLPGLLTNSPRLPAIQGPGLGDPASAPYINSKILRFNGRLWRQLLPRFGQCPCPVVGCTSSVRPL